MNKHELTGLVAIMAKGVVDELTEERKRGTATVQEYNGATNTFKQKEVPIERDYDYLIKSFTKLYERYREKFQKEEL